MTTSTTIRFPCTSVAFERNADDPDEYTALGYKVLRRGPRDYMVTDPAYLQPYKVAHSLRAAAEVILAWHSEDFLAV